MTYHLFTDDERLKEQIEGLMDMYDDWEAHPAGGLWSHSFGKHDVAIVEAHDKNNSSRIRTYMGSSIPAVFLLDAENAAMGNEHMKPENIYLPWPCTTSQLKRALEDAGECREKLDLLSLSLVGNSEAMARLRSNIILASLSHCPVHLAGETGTGKTLSAKLIHNLAGNRKPLVYINCATLQSSLSDSDLFGHVKGAYTNASSDRPGFLSEANGSTLFLDEIGDLPEDVQGKLLDVIENGTYRSMGSDKEKKTSFRLITAGKESLAELVDAKKLRQDFYYRISSFEIELEPLRKHTEDIPLIVDRYFKEHRSTNIFKDDCSVLMHGDWRGNVRELLHYLENTSAGR